MAYPPLLSEERAYPLLTHRASHLASVSRAFTLRTSLVKNRSGSVEFVILLVGFALSRRGHSLFPAIGIRSALHGRFDSSRTKYSLFLLETRTIEFRSHTSRAPDSDSLGSATSLTHAFDTHSHAIHSMCTLTGHSSLKHLLPSFYSSHLTGSLLGVTQVCHFTHSFSWYSRCLYSI